MKLYNNEGNQIEVSALVNSVTRFEGDGIVYLTLDLRIKLQSGVGVVGAGEEEGGFFVTVFTVKGEYTLSFPTETYELEMEEARGYTLRILLRDRTVEGEYLNPNELRL